MHRLHRATHKHRARLVSSGWFILQMLRIHGPLIKIISFQHALLSECERNVYRQKTYKKNELYELRLVEMRIVPSLLMKSFFLCVLRGKFVIINILFIYSLYLLSYSFNDGWSSWVFMATSKRSKIFRKMKRKIIFSNDFHWEIDTSHNEFNHRKFYCSWSYDRSINFIDIEMY